MQNMHSTMTSVPKASKKSQRQEACLAALRAELAVSYPQIRPGRLLWILRRHSLAAFPTSFFVAGRLFDFSKRGAFANLMRLRQGRDGHVLFSKFFYETAYPDIADAGAPAWAHFQTRGRGEGRSPHPLFDIPWLRAALDEDEGVQSTGLTEPLDEYLNNAAFWRVSPSPFVDCGGFLSSGLWDGARNPLEQIVSEHLQGPWISHRLMLIDAESTDSTAPADSAERVVTSAARSLRFRLLAAGILLFRNFPIGRISQVHRWRVVEPRYLPATGGNLFTVTPGFAVGVDGQIALVGKKMLLSPESSMIASDELCLSLNRGMSWSTSSLVVMGGELSHSELVNMLGQLTGPAILAPFSSFQEQAMSNMIVMAPGAEIVVLPWGQQSHVATQTLTFIPGGTTGAEVEPWIPMPEGPLAGTVIVLPYSQRRRASEDNFVLAVLERGASLSLIVDNHYGDWMTVLAHSDFVVADATTARDLHTFVPSGKLRMLPGETRGQRS